MRVYLIRHGEAGVAASDGARELTAEGRARTRDNGVEALNRMTAPVATILCSPLTRARQTAGIIHGLWGSQASLLVDDCLVPEGSPPRVGEFVDALGPDAWPLVLVGHQPLLGALLAWLTDRGELARTVSTSSIFALDLTHFERGCGTLAWQLT